jgi:hypothetical protein
MIAMHDCVHVCLPTCLCVRMCACGDSVAYLQVLDEIGLDQFGRMAAPKGEHMHQTSFSACVFHVVLAEHELGGCILMCVQTCTHTL